VVRLGPGLQRAQKPRESTLIARQRTRQLPQHGGELELKRQRGLALACDQRIDLP
jgi:hypothetical protein